MTKTDSTLKQTSSDEVMGKLDKKGNIDAFLPPSSFLRQIKQPLDGNMQSDTIVEKVLRPVHNGASQPIQDICLAGKFAFALTESGRVYLRTGKNCSRVCAAD